MVAGAGPFFLLLEDFIASAIAFFTVIGWGLVRGLALAFCF